MFKIYFLVRQSRDQGIWLRDLLTQSTLHRGVVNKSLKLLTDRALVKMINSIRHPTKKIYICTDIQPDVDVVGGTFFTDSELDVEFVRVLTVIVLTFIDNNTKLITDKGLTCA